ncbi:MAG: alkyl hydroperoxide reductase/Thiol specific antioxidant/Mal allergen, partial [Mucilaginibacter sp.]|nr:alkyl hydroperoxide reductase/Thiol specific antioxidant/Mal allergen [Mucilaginibacter sp.]
RLINVWATWCGPCTTEFPEFININRMYRRRDFEMITISADDPAKMNKALKFLQQAQASTTNYIFNTDDKYKLINAIDPKWQGALPYTLLIEPGGKIAYAKEGIIDPGELKKLIVDDKYIGRYY